MTNSEVQHLSTVGDVRRLATALLTALGVPADPAGLTAKALTLAEIWGVKSHGLMRLPYYLARLRAGGISAAAELVAVTDRGPLVAYDGGAGMGHWQAWRAAECAAQRCATFGIAAVSVGNSTHCGALGIYTLPIVEAGFVGLVFSNGPAVMPPWGGSRPVLSTSPLAAGIPCRPHPAIIDMATTAVARGRIAERAHRNEPLPEGWALDSVGAPTVDPRAALTGMLAPLGGAKGYALALLVEALTGGAVGPALSTSVSDMFAADSAATPQRIAHLVVAMDPMCLSVDGNAEERMDALAAQVTAAGGRLPGAKRRTLDGIADDEPLHISPETAAELEEWATSVGIRPMRGGKGR